MSAPLNGENEPPFCPFKRRCEHPNCLLDVEQCASALMASARPTPPGAPACGVLFDPNERVTGRVEFFHRCVLPNEHGGDHSPRVSPPEGGALACAFCLGGVAHFPCVFGPILPPARRKAEVVEFSDDDDPRPMPDWDDEPNTSPEDSRDLPAEYRKDGGAA